MQPSRFTDVEKRGDVFCVRLRRQRLDESEILALAEELLGLVRNGGCRKLALSLGPTPPEFLYSVFLAKLISLQRNLRERGGELAVCHAGPEVRSIFEACSLDGLFLFLPDFDAAVAHWKS
jgi:anti-anti-sigma regulatory factor